MLETAPCGRGSESVLSVYSDRQSRDHRERFARRVFQHRLQPCESRLKDGCKLAEKHPNRWPPMNADKRGLRSSQAIDSDFFSKLVSVVVRQNTRHGTAGVLVAAGDGGTVHRFLARVADVFFGLGEVPAEREFCQVKGRFFREVMGGI